MSIVGLQFEWDENKNQRNFQKHGIRFSSAAKVFDDPDRIDIYDTRHSHEEDRYITIGMTQKVLFVVYTQRVNHVRIISARLATKWEQEVYWNGYCDY